MTDHGTQDLTRDVALTARFLDRETGVETPCLLVYRGGEEILIRTTAVPAVGADLICYSESVGRITGPVTEREAGGFVLRAQGSEAMRARVFKRLRWLREHGHGAEDLRQESRFVPHRVETEFRVADDTEVIKAEIIDVSRSGVSIASKLRPPIGTRIYVGKRGADVVRGTDQGFAARFLVPLPATDVDENVRL